MAHQPNSSGLVKIGVSVLLLALAGGITAWTMIPKSAPTVTGTYFYDLSTGRLFTMPVGTVGPAVPPSNSTGEATGVRAYVYSCGACDKEADRKVGYLETPDPNPPRNAAGPAGLASRLPELQSPMLIAAPDKKDQWFAASSKEGTAIRESLRTKCDGKMPTQCLPQAR